MRRLLLLLVLIFPLAAPAEAVTVRDIIELSRAGLGEEVLLALIEVDRGTYAIDNDTLKTLKDAGVSDRVIAAMVRSGRAVRPLDVSELQEMDPQTMPVPVATPAPQVVVIDHHDEERVREVPVAVPVPVFIPVDNTRRRHFIQDGRRLQTVRPVDSPFIDDRLIKQPKPVYWGFGGKRRPDTWAPDPKHEAKPPKTDAKPPRPPS